jgi:hypothetical protein
MKRSGNCKNIKKKKSQHFSFVFSQHFSDLSKQLHKTSFPRAGSGQLPAGPQAALRLHPRLSRPRFLHPHGTKKEQAQLFFFLILLLQNARVTSSLK